MMNNVYIFCCAGHLSDNNHFDTGIRSSLLFGVVFQLFCILSLLTIGVFTLFAPPNSRSLEPNAMASMRPFIMYNAEYAAFIAQWPVLLLSNVCYYRRNCMADLTALLATSIIKIGII